MLPDERLKSSANAGSDGFVQCSAKEASLASVATEVRLCWQRPPFPPGWMGFPAAGRHWRQHCWRSATRLTHTASFAVRIRLVSCGSCRAFALFGSDAVEPWPPIGEIDPFQCNICLRAIVGRRTWRDRTALCDTPSIRLRSVALPRGGRDRRSSGDPTTTMVPMHVSLDILEGQRGCCAPLRARG